MPDNESTPSVRRRSLSLSPDPFEISIYVKCEAISTLSSFSDISIQLARADLGIVISDSSDEEEDTNDDHPCLTNPAISNRELLTSQFLRNLYHNNDELFIVRYLAWSGQTPELKRVLNHGSDQIELIGAKNHEGDTLLHLVLQAGRTETAAYLIRKKPELAYELNGDGISPLYLAVKGRFRPLVKYIFRRLPGREVLMDIRKKLVGVANASVAHAAVKTRDSGILQTIFSNLPELVGSKDSRGWKPISYAAYRGYHEEVCYFLDYFPNCIKECDDDGSFPIHKAISGGNLSIVTLFITSYPKLMFQKDRKLRTVLHIAARYRRTNVLHYFMRILKHEIQSRNDGNTYNDFLELRDIDGNTYKDLIS